MKKRKSHKNLKKPRNESIYVRTSGKVTEISFQIDPQTGEIIFVTPVERKYNEVSYERAKGPKVLNKTPLSGPALQIDPNEALINNYDLLVAVDTNTRLVQDQKISVTGIVIGNFVVDPLTGSTAVAFQTPYCLEFVDIIGNPEHKGWVMALRQLQKDDFLGTEGRIALIVDSDLSNLPEFNSRNIPITDDFHLPEPIDLVYASSDTGNEYCANKLLRMADRVSNRVLDYLNAGKAPLNRNYINGKLYKAFRIITGQSK